MDRHHVLQRTHRTDDGLASSRSSGIVVPQRSQMPYVPSSNFSSARRTLDELRSERVGLPDSLDAPDRLARAFTDPLAETDRRRGIACDRGQRVELGLERVALLLERQPQRPEIEGHDTAPLEMSTRRSCGSATSTVPESPLATNSVNPASCSRTSSPGSGPSVSSNRTPPVPSPTSRTRASGLNRRAACSAVRSSPAARGLQVIIGRCYRAPVTTSLRLPLRGPRGEPVDLARTLNSHGFADLAPSAFDAQRSTLSVTLPVRGSRPRRIRIGPGRGVSARVEVLGAAAGPRVQAAALAGAAHVLRLDQDLAGFYALVAEDPDLAWAAAGAGRMLRSPTVFEDVVKTICTTNCAWGATVRMVNVLVSSLGEPAIGGDGPLTNAFPTPSAMRTAPASFYRDIVRAGYRGAYLIELARRVDAGEVNLEAMAASSAHDRPDDDIEQELLDLPGVGPYAAAHIMMTIGRNSRLILDSWTRPTYARLVGRKRVADATIMRRFRRYGPHAGLAFWLYLTRDWVEG